jgi:hypothetical protein
MGVLSTTVVREAGSPCPQALLSLVSEAAAVPRCRLGAACSDPCTQRGSYTHVVRDSNDRAW